MSHLVNDSALTSSRDPAVHILAFYFFTTAMKQLCRHSESCRESADVLHHAPAAVIRCRLNHFPCAVSLSYHTISFLSVPLSFFVLLHDLL